MLPGDAAQPSLGNPEADRTLEPADIREQIADLVLGIRSHGQDEEDRSLGGRRQNDLRFSSGHVGSVFLRRLSRAATQSAPAPGSEVPPRPLR